MRENKFKLMELFLYIMIVAVGLAFLLFGKAEPKPGGGVEPPPAAEAIHTKRGESFAVLPDEQ